MKRLPSTAALKRHALAHSLLKARGINPKRSTKKNSPSLARIQAQLPSGRWISFNGVKFSAGGRAKLYGSIGEASTAARALLKKFPALRKYAVRVARGQFTGYGTRVNPRALNGAARLYEEFRESAPERAQRLQVKLPKALAAVGHAEFIGYRTSHGKQHQAYRHDFAPGARPILAAGTRRGELYLIGDRFRFTDRGIVDVDARGKQILD